MAQPLTQPGRSETLLPNNLAEQLQKAYDYLKSKSAQPTDLMTLGQLNDKQTGLKPLSKKPKPEPPREVPDFPESTYNFLKRNGNAPS